MSDIEMRKQDRGAVNAIARAYGQPAPYRTEKKPPPIKEVERIKEAAAEKEDRIDKLCAEIEALHICDGPGRGHQIARAVAKAYNISWAEFRSKRRWPYLVKARQHAMWEIRHATTLSLPAIGRVLGGLDHTTILWGIRAHQKRLDEGADAK